MRRNGVTFERHASGNSASAATRAWRQVPTPGVEMSSAGTSSILKGNRGALFSGRGQHRAARVRERLVMTVAVGLFLSAFLAACSGFFISPSLTSMYVNPPSATITASNTAQLVAYGYYSDGSQNKISSDSLSWSSSDPTIATVTSPGGLVTGVSAGSATITATITVNVPGSSCYVTVTAGSLSKVCPSGGSETLTATGNVSVTAQ